MDSGTEVQSLNEIENYLVNFNKEISGDDSEHRFMLTSPGSSHNENSGSLYTDSDPSGDGLAPHLLALQGAPVGIATRVITTDDNPVDQDVLQDSSTEDISNQTTSGNQNAGPFPTVTIVPSEVNQGGEVSYVLIVSQQNGKGAEADADMSIYDFKEEKAVVDPESFTEEEEERPQRRGRRSLGMLDATPVTVGNAGGGVNMHLMCNYCNYTSSKRYLLARHMKAHSEERPHKCSICGRTFKTVIALQNHVNTHTGVRPQHCKECDASFTTSGELVRHVRYRHTYEKPHKCTECDYASVELSKLRRHVRSHTGERPYQCPHCQYASPDTYKLKRHLRVHTGEKPYECDICGLRFTQSNSLKAHKLIHTGQKPIFQCELCPTTCGRKTDLKYHVMKLHTSDKPLLCRKCGKAFPDRYTHKIHLKTHEGEKCFRCELCPYSALDQRHLESHILTHTGEKPYACSYCEVSFRQKQLLRRHINLYHVPGYVPPPPRSKVHLCTHCNKLFAHRGNLLRHLAIHDPTNAEYQAAINQHEGGSTGEEDNGDEDEMLNEDDDDGPTFLELHNASAAADGVQLTEIDGEQVQVQLVRVSGQEGEQVYLQIGTDEMEMLTQQQAQQVQEEAGLMLTVDNKGPQVNGASPSKRPRGRPRKNPVSIVNSHPESDEEYSAAAVKPSQSRSGRPVRNTHKPSRFQIDDPDLDQVIDNIKLSRRKKVRVETKQSEDVTDCDLSAELVALVGNIDAE